MKILVFPNYQVAAFDEAGQQIPKLQLGLLKLFAEHMEREGVNPNGLIIETPVGDFRIFRCESSWNSEPLSTAPIGCFVPGSTQDELRKNYGTPAEFARGAYAAVPGMISMDEARAAVDGFCRAWEEAGTGTLADLLPQGPCDKCQLAADIRAAEKAVEEERNFD